MKFAPTRASAAFVVALEGNGRDTYLVNAGVKRERGLRREYPSRTNGERSERGGPLMSNNRVHLSTLAVPSVEVQKVAPPSSRTRPLGNPRPRPPLVLHLFVPCARPRGPFGLSIRVLTHFPLPGRFARTRAHARHMNACAPPPHPHTHTYTTGENVPRLRAVSV